MPKKLSPTLIAPLLGCIRAVNVMPMPTVLTSTGKKTTERRKVRTRISEVSSTPSSMPKMTLRPDVTTA